jgi:hypothetical protein
MNSLPKGKSMGTKLVELFANHVVERKNMINDYLRGSACIESVRGSWFQGECWFWAFILILSFSCSSELFLTLLCHFAWLCHFSCLLLAFAVLLLDDLLELFWLFGSSSCASWGIGFELQTLCFYCQWTHQGGDWETKWSVPWFDCDESLTWRCLNSNPRQFCFIFLLSLSHSDNHVCLSHGVQVAGAVWRAATRIVAGVGDLMQRTGDRRTGRVLDGRAIERSGGTVCGLHRAHGDDECRFLDWASKPSLMVCHWFDLKTTGTVSHRFSLKTGGDGFWRFGLKICCGSFLWFGLKTSGNGFLQFGLKTSGDGFSRFDLKTGGRVSWFSLKTKVVEGFPVWASKPVATVWWFVSQNHCGGFLVCALKPIRLRFIGCATKSMEEGRRGTHVEI